MSFMKMERKHIMNLILWPLIRATSSILKTGNSTCYEELTYNDSMRLLYQELGCFRIISYSFHCYILHMQYFQCLLPNMIHSNHNLKKLLGNQTNLCCKEPVSFEINSDLMSIQIWCKNLSCATNSK